MHRKPGVLVEIASVGKDVPTTSFVDVKTDHLPADRTLRRQRVETPAAKKLDELNGPYGKEPHARPLTVEATQTPLCV